MTTWMSRRFNPELEAGALLGFYQAGDEILSWLNSLDTSEMAVKDLRSALVHHILGMKYASRRFTSEERDRIFTQWEGLQDQMSEPGS